MVRKTAKTIKLTTMRLTITTELQIVNAKNARTKHTLIQNRKTSLILSRRDSACLSRVLTTARNQKMGLILRVLTGAGLNGSLPLLAVNKHIIIINDHNPMRVGPESLVDQSDSVTTIGLFTAPTRALKRVRRTLGSNLRRNTLGPVIGRTTPLRTTTATRRNILTPKTLNG